MKFILHKKIRFRSSHYLIFFLWICSLACGSKKNPEITLVWKNERVTGLSIPIDQDENIDGSLEEKVNVRLVTLNERTPMLGYYSISGGNVLFEPLVPFTPGLKFEVLINKQFAGEISIPKSNSVPAASLLNVYPGQDTVPENLLKFYFVFSSPMSEGHSVRYLSLIDGRGDTLQDVFLDLESELWDRDRETLTVWLDPGRIKRGLQPNLISGNPLQKGEDYTLIISDQWRDYQGDVLSKSFSKHLFVGSRDSLSPNPRLWNLQLPVAGSLNALHIEFKEALDYGVLQSSLHILDAHQKEIKGNWKFTHEEKEADFTPEQSWISGDYFFMIETRLEDLAGNNINRTFEVDIKNKPARADSAAEMIIPFSILND